MPTVLITATGAGTWTVPAGVTSVYAEVWAGTGGGQYGTGSGGGAYSASTISVTPGQVISYYVAQALPYSQGGAKVIGQDSWVVSASTVMAKGSDGPYGGKAAEGYGTTKFSGGDAEYAVPEFGTPPTVDASYARAGGGAASPSGNGQPGRYNPYTDASVGGDSPGAGQGATASNAAQSNVNGGGGGGNPSSSSTPQSASGGAPGGGVGYGGVAGSRGQIRITYDEPVAAPIVQVITATGAGSVTVPAGYNTVVAECWSGGQGAQIQKGGDGGNYARSEFAVSSGETFSHSVGAGGVGVSAASRNNGGDTWVGSTSTLIAKGGGIRTGSIGQTVYLGGLGFEEMRGGGGGGAAHPLGAGGNAPTDSEGGSNYLKGGSSGSRAGIIGTGVSNVEGGAGGGGGSNNVAGGAPGGGGGGGYAGTGGTGGRGQIRYTFTYDPTATPSVPARKAPRSATIQ